MLFPETKTTTTEKTVLLRDDHEGTWIAVYDPDRGMTDVEGDAFSGCSWMRLGEALDRSQRHFVPALFFSDHEANQTLAAMVARWGVGTVSGTVRTGIIDVTWCPGHYEAGSSVAIIEALDAR